MSFEVPFIRPVFPESRLIGYDFDRIVESNWYTNFGPMERKFSEAITDYIGEGFHAATFNNATSALLAVVQCVLGSGDGTRSIIVPSFTFAAGPAAIEWNGYRPLFIDIDVTTLQPLIADAEAALVSGRTDVAGILLCNTFGIGNAEINQWQQLARRFEVPLMVDSAAGFGSRYDDATRVGTAGVCEVFSFHATKPFAIGEGGAVVTRDADLAVRLREFQNFGFTPGIGATALGLNGKLQEINAAIGLRQLETFDDAVASRQVIARGYAERVDPAVFGFPPGLFASSVCFASVLLPTHALREQVLSTLLDAGVEARVYYAPAVHAQPRFAAAERFSGLSGTESVVSRIIALPVHQNMTSAAMGRVVDALNRGTSK